MGVFYRWVLRICLLYTRAHLYSIGTKSFVFLHLCIVVCFILFWTCTFFLWCNPGERESWPCRLTLVICILLAPTSLLSSVFYYQAPICPPLPHRPAIPAETQAADSGINFSSKEITGFPNSPIHFQIPQHFRALRRETLWYATPMLISAHLNAKWQLGARLQI